MYDSRSDGDTRPPRKRLTGEAQFWANYEAERERTEARHWRKIRHSNRDAAIAEGLADMEPEPESVVGDGLTRAGECDWARSWLPEPLDEEPLAEWERELLGLSDLDDEWDEPLDEWDEPLADWERELLADTPEYTSTSDGVSLDYQDECEDWPEDEFDRHWLATPADQFFDALGDAWVVEGPSMTRPEPLREGHYVRVWQLAEDLCVESRHVIEVLRLAGEYVKTHQSYVAKPVAEAVMLGREWIVAKYGEREDRAPGKTLRYLLLQEDQRAKVERPGPNPFSTQPTPRPGMPRPTTTGLDIRPGRNPFRTRSM